jgi:murein endopeptidase
VSAARLLAISATLAVAAATVAAIQLAAGSDGPSPAKQESPSPSDSADTRDRERRPPKPEPRPIRRPIEYRESTALGSPGAGSLTDGVKLPPEGRHYFTWDPVEHESPSAPWRRWGTDDLVRTTLRVIHEYARAHPAAPRVGVGDLSLPEGGYFGPEVSGGIGHATHQNGLDVDVYYPIRSAEERAPRRVDEIRMRLAQDLVDRFVAAGAEVIYVGPNTPLSGPEGVVIPLVNHDNHLHVRIGG